MDLDLFARDVDAVLTFARSRYQFKSVFLIGVSWGGGIAATALLNPASQAKYKGWIEVDGGHNAALGWRLSMQWYTDKANEYYANPPNGTYAADWKKTADWFGANPYIALDDQAQINQLNVNASKILKIDDPVSVADNSSVSSSLAMLWFSPLGLDLIQNVNSQKWDFRTIDLSSRMIAITLPSLILWGGKDRNLPVALAQDAYDSLGTPAADTSVVIFPDSAHCAMFTNSDNVEFVAAVSRFIEKYK